MSILKNIDLTSGPRSDISAACLRRILDNYPTTSEPYPMRTLYPSSIYELTPKAAVLAYYVPDVVSEPWLKLMYTEHGKAAEKIIQSCLFRAGVLKCDHHQFLEPKVYCPELGISGRVDSIAYKERILAAGNVKGPQQYTGETLTEIILELKETSHYQYSRIECEGDIPMKFKWAQAAYQKILGIPESCFIYINRDSMDLKPVFFRSTAEMQDELTRKCDLIWTAINTKSWQESDGTTVHLEDFLKEIPNG